MDNSFNPYDSPRSQQQRQQANMRFQQAAFGVEEALYMQRQRELQRDLQIRQLLLQEQLDQRNFLGGVATSLQQQQQQQQRLYELQQYAQGVHPTMAGLHQEEQRLLNQHREEELLLKQQEQLRRLQLQQPQSQLQSQQTLYPMNAVGGTMGGGEFGNDVRINDVSASYMKRPSVPAASRKRAGSEEIDLTTFKQQIHRNDPISREEFYKREGSLQGYAAYHDGTSDDILHVKPRPKRSKTAQKKREVKEGQALLNAITDSNDRNAVEGLLQSAGDARIGVTSPSLSPSPEEEILVLGSVKNLLEAAAEEEKAEDAANIIISSFKSVEWPESEDEEDEQPLEMIKTLPDAVTIDMPNFKSAIPSIQEEPVFESMTSEQSKSPHVDGDAPKNGDSGPADESGTVKETPKNASKTASLSGSPRSPVDYPYPVDTWWPSITTVRRERRLHNEKSDEEDFVETDAHTPDSRFRADIASIRARFTNDIEPGVLEKLPHCRIHRQRMRSHKGGNAPDHAFCWQVTETYCNDVMVCCSICSTWRHASCGGHYKPYSVRECIKEGTPFEAVCEQCYEEQALLEQFQRGKARLARQRTEQLRRSLQTAAVIRQASFAKHSGTYKWPLGSVSATHIGGHTRSVHSRHDKAEKQWSEMAQKVGRGFGFRPKERSKIRTRELERLLVSIEDAEAFTDRHNMTLFLQNDIRKEYPAGFATPRRNIFDPSDDLTADATSTESFSTETTSAADDQAHQPPPLSHESHNIIGRKAGPHAPRLDQDMSDTAMCARKDCPRKSRFDSMFCSDACGVVAFEADLLRSLQYAEDIHPSHLRN